MKPPSIVIVEKESETRDLLMLAFESRGYMTWSCPTQKMASHVFLAAQPDVVLVDLEDGTEDSLHFVRTWKRAAPRTQVIILSGDTNTVQKEALLAQGAYAYLAKPITPELLFDALNGPEMPAESSQAA